jgi:rare lipoprotein A (peptidoglycan hydrolase)
MKGGALRNQSTGGRRLGVAAIICGVLFGAPLLLLQNATTHAARSEAAARDVPRHADAVRGGTKLDGVNLASHLVAYHAPATTTTTAPATAPSTTPPAPTATPTTVPPPAPTPPPPTTTTTTAPPPPTTTTTTAPPRVVAANNEVGEATWYSAAAPGTCASPTLPFGTVVTVVNNATGASTSCTVDDREGAGYPRVVDLSPDGFSQIADLNEGVVDVTISW